MKKIQKIQITENDLHRIIESTVKEIMNEGLQFNRDDLEELSEYLQDYGEEAAKSLLFSLGKEQVWNILNQGRDQFDERAIEEEAKSIFLNNLNNLEVKIYNEDEDYIEYEATMNIDDEFSFNIDSLVLDLPENKFETPIGVEYNSASKMVDGNETFYLDGEDLRAFTNFMHTHYPVNRQGINSPDIDFDDYEEIE